VKAVALGQVYNGLLRRYHVIPPIIPTHLQPKDKWEKAGNLPKTNAFPEIREHWIQNYFHILVLSRITQRMLMTGVHNRYPIFICTFYTLFYISHLQTHSNTTLCILTVTKYHNIDDSLLSHAKYTPHFTQNRVQSATNRSISDFNTYSDK
jgi:hypothetical protein